MSKSDHGWHHYMHQTPQEGVLVEFRQMVENLLPIPNWVGYKEDLHPEMNVAQLHWRLTGIGKQQMSRLSQQAGAAEKNR